MMGRVQRHKTAYFIMSNTPCGYCPHPKRALIKAAAVLVALGLLIWGGFVLIDDSAIDQMKFDLSLGALIMLVVAVNAVSLVFFVLLYMAYQWVRCDLKAPRSEDSRIDADEED
jgi:TRAP-type C4-dicarboxylate transport system permease small subunit